MKKMRRLIPAFAMLLVAATMLSTASFAWFTMNESVTATGMQVKAKASGNLLISENKMSAADQAITVALTNRNTNSSTDIIPVTYTTGWKIPGNSAAVDPTYGGMASTDNLVDPDKSVAYTGSPYFIDYTVYVATAGDAMTTQNLYITMNMVSAAEDIAPAYSIAFYVGDPAQGETLGTFAGYINYKYFAENPGAKVYLNGTYTIPSTYGKSTDDAQGLRITMRVFVDGNLKYNDKVIPQVPNYQPAAEKYGNGDTLKYYEKKTVNGVDTYILQDKTLWTAETVTEGMFTWDGTYKNGTAVDKYYVNNGDIPTGATSFDVTIGATANDAMPTTPQKTLGITTQG